MFDVAVIGAGVMGSATARAAARRGKSVVLFERFQIGHKRGSSHGRSRIFRYSYPEETYVRMAQEALPLWLELEREAVGTLLTITGGLDIGTTAVESAAALEACGAAAEMLTEDEALARFPYLDPPQGEPVLYSPDARVIAADPAWLALARSAQSHGAELREGTSVTSLERKGDIVEIRTDIETVPAGVAVVTAGAWARPLLARVGIDLAVRPTRQTVAYFHLPEDMPPAVVEWGDHMYYALASPGEGMKVGEHVLGDVADPDDAGQSDRESIARLTSWVTQRFPPAARAPFRTETCLYTNTKDERFVLERHGPIVVGSPCSGHGFKFAPLIGERLATLAGV